MLQENGSEPTWGLPAETWQARGTRGTHQARGTRGHTLATNPTSDAHGREAKAPGCPWGKAVGCFGFGVAIGRLPYM